MPQQQDPTQAPYLLHAADIPLIEEEIALLSRQAAANPKNSSLAAKLGRAQARLRHTQDRLAHDQAAAVLVDSLGLTHEISEDTITHNDAVGFIAKQLHERQQGVSASIYARSHRHLRGVVTKNADGQAVVHCDEAKLAAPRDFAQEVVDHLGLTDPAHIAAVQALFTAAAPAAGKAVS